MKQGTLFLGLLVLLLTSACASAEESEAKANYVQAKADEIAANARLAEAQAVALELQNANNAEFKAQQLELNRLSWEATEARLDSIARTKEQAVRVVAFAIAAATLTGITVWVWVRERVKLLEASEREAQAKTQAYAARFFAFKELRSMLAEERQFKLELQPVAIQSNGKVHAQRSAPSVNQEKYSIVER